MAISTTPIILAQALDVVDTTANLALGTVVKTDDGGEMMYVQAASAIDKYAGVVIQEGHTVVNLTTGAVTEGSGTGKQVGWAQVTIPSASYGWVQISGRPLGKLAANCADQVILFTTSTAGVMDDATVSAALVAGVIAGTTISNATAVTLLVAGQAYVHPFVNPG